MCPARIIELGKILYRFQLLRLWHPIHTHQFFYIIQITIVIHTRDGCNPIAFYIESEKILVRDIPTDNDLIPTGRMPLHRAERSPTNVR